MVTYLVSGALDIRPSDENIRLSGRRVRFDAEVDDRAASVLQGHGRFVVVAHGDANGTVTWFSSASGEASHWLWVGMADPPADARIYLYSCFAGLSLPAFLTQCEVFGHSHEVPMPTEGAREVVLAFFVQVDRLLSHDAFDAELWRRDLSMWVNRALVAEVNNRTGMLAAAALYMLRKSLGFVDD